MMSRSYIPKRFLGAFKAGHRHSAREFIDEELSFHLLRKVLSSYYTDLEAMEALDYLTKFNNEYHKAVLKKNDSQALHNTDELYQDRSTANNARNRDIMSVMRTKVDSLTPVKDVEGMFKSSREFRSINSCKDNLNHEEVLIDLLDLKNKISMI